jgi:hypothetical protein
VAEPRPAPSASFQVIDGSDRTVAPIKFASRIAAKQHAQKLLGAGVAGPLFIGQVIERTTRQAARTTLVRPAIARPTLQLLRARFG